MAVTSEMFVEEVDKLLVVKELLPLNERIEQVELICEWYFRETGKRPPGYELDRLGTYILADELRSRDTHKVKQTEYPILSHTQQKLRNRRESRVGDENIDFIKLKEVHTHPAAFKVKTKNKEEV